MHDLALVWKDQDSKPILEAEGFIATSHDCFQKPPATVTNL
jgi:hypothetical protein